MAKKNNRKKSKRRRAIVISIFIIALILAVLAVNKLKGNNSAQPTIMLARAKMGPLQERVSASGSFQAEDYTVVSSQTMGIVKDVYVKPGDYVEINDVIVEVDEREALEKLTSAEISLEDIRRRIISDMSGLRADISNAKVTIAQASRSADKALSLRESNAISEDDYRKALQELERAKSSLSSLKYSLCIMQGLPLETEPYLDSKNDNEIIESSPSFRNAELTLESARRALDGCVIRAEGKGIVTEMGVTVGSRLTVESKVARIEDPSSMIADVFVDEIDVGKIRAGFAASITADSLLGRTINGEINRIWPIVKNEGGGRVCQVRISLDLEGQQVLSGASCMARIVSVLREEALIIPASAMIPGANPPAVWVAVPISAESADKIKSDNSYLLEFRNIEIGLSAVAELEVISGLAEGELVAADRLNLLYENMQVQGMEI